MKLITNHNYVNFFFNSQSIDLCDRFVDFIKYIVSLKYLKTNIGILDVIKYHIHMMVTLHISALGIRVDHATFWKKMTSRLYEVGTLVKCSEPMVQP